MRLCDLDEIKIQVKRQYEDCHGYSGNKKAIYREAILAVRSILHSAKAIDAVPVVRCRECKHFRHYGKTSLFINGKNIKAGWCQRRISYDEEYRMTADDFCSYGERKEGADR